MYKTKENMTPNQRKRKWADTNPEMATVLYLTGKNLKG